MPITLSGSLSLTGSVVASGNLTTTGTITAQTLVVQTITSSINYITGSSDFGSLQSNRHTFTGSLFITGSTSTFSGCIGIGTSSPTRLLDVNGVIRTRDAGSAGAPSIELGTSAQGNGLFYPTTNTIAITTNDTERMRITSAGIACFACQVCAPQLILGGADQGYVLDVKRTSTGDANFDTVANFYKASTNATQLLIRAKNSLIDIAGSYVIGGGGPNTGLSFSVSPSGGSPTEAMRITSAGNVGIGTCSPSALLDTTKNDSAGNFLNSTADVVARFGNCNINPGNHYSTGIQVFQGCGTLGSGYAAGFLVADNNTATAQQSNTVSLISPSSMSGGVSLIAADASAPIRMFTGGFTCERMRINNCGQLSLGVSNSNGFTFRISSNTNNNSVDPRKIMQLGNECINAITAYMYIGSYAGIDWLVGKDTCGAGDYRFNLSLYTGETRMTLYTNGNYSFAGSNVSDIRLKCNINSLCINAIDKINTLVPKCYYMEDKIRYGFIAQDVKTTLPDLISGEEKEKEYLGLDYNGVLAVAVKAIQEQQCTICSQASIINTLKTCIGIA